jgi:demethylmenaquinone methyltransferase/2-methoxy-6-polyprenyl-1,4-benzoquinol methylase
MDTEKIQNHNKNTKNIFDSISKKYDISNLILSMGLEKKWRCQFLNCIRPGQNRVLDACCGTGTSTYHLWLNGSTEVTGIDFSRGMIEIARKRYKDKEGITFYTKDVTDTGFADNSFDCAAIAFGIRNILEREKALSELFRIVRPSGSIVILEFNHINKGIFGRLSGIYINSLMPFMGGLITNNRKAYEYLAKSIREFPEPERFMKIMRTSGWKSISHLSLTGGICSIFTGRKD